MQMSGDERYVLDEAQAEIKRLTAENARLRGEAKKWCDACGCADGANMALRADLAHVTAERDGLLAMALHVLAWDPEGGAGRTTPMTLNEALRKLRACIAACAPPAPDKETP
jgi:hypothetical protein